MDVEHIPPIFRQRGLSDETVRRFAAFIFLVRDKRNGNFDGYNIGFPYTGADGQVKGYEIRGYGGYKSKAAGTDSSSAAWVADLIPKRSGACSSVSPPSTRWLSTR